MGRLWDTFYGQLSKMVNWFRQKDPVAQMQLEYDKAVLQLKDGREGLEQYRGLVERVSKKVLRGEQRKQKLTAKIKTCLEVGDREFASQLAIQLAETDKELAENQEQLEQHKKSYQNNLDKIRYATSNLTKVRKKIKTYEAELKMSEVEAQIAERSQSFNFDITTDFGQLEPAISEELAPEQTEETSEKQEKATE